MSKGSKRAMRSGGQVCTVFMDQMVYVDLGKVQKNANWRSMGCHGCDSCLETVEPRTEAFRIIGLGSSAVSSASVPRITGLHMSDSLLISTDRRFALV